MRRAVFLLGPDEWDEGPPAWWAPGAGQGPKRLRLDLKDALGRIGVPCVVMDPSDQLEGEADDAFFHRLETQHHVERYIIIVPPQTKILGTVFEGGMLVRDFHYGRNPEIMCFFHETFAKTDGRGQVTFTDQGKRTRYLESLAAKAHHVGFWADPEELVPMILRWATLP